MKRRWVLLSIFLACLLVTLVSLKAISTESNKVVYVFSDSCGYCSSFKPVFDKVTTDFLAQNTGWEVERLDIFKDHELAKAQEMGAEATPTVFIVKNGEVVDKLEGEVPSKSLKRFLYKNVDGKQNKGVATR